jgi:ATP-dependent exoDNAse (exonuclease V) beta subunit
MHRLTNSSITDFQTCQKKYFFRNVRELAPIREYVPALWLGTLIHLGLEHYYRSGSLAHGTAMMRAEMGPDTNPDDACKAIALFNAYLNHYSGPDDLRDTPADIEQTYTIRLRNPDTGYPSQRFMLAGKIDMLLETSDGAVIVDHKTASDIDGKYLEKLWSNRQLHLYAHLAEQATGRPIITALYNVLVKCKLQRLGISQKRAEPQSDEEYFDRLSAWYAEHPEVFIRERIVIMPDTLQAVMRHVWQVSQQINYASRTGTWVQSLDACHSQWGRACPYLPICQSNDSPLVIENEYEHKPAHSELEDEQPEMAF